MSCRVFTSTSFSFTEIIGLGDLKIGESELFTGGYGDDNEEDLSSDEMLGLVVNFVRLEGGEKK